jgi:peptide/nickel transport system substrate-binding protein
MFLNSSYRGDTDGSTYATWHSQGVQNRGKCSDPQLDPILERARQVYDIAERRRLYGQAEKYLIENNNLIIYPMHSPLEVVHSKKVVNYTLTPDFIYRFRMVGMGIQR